MQHITFFTEKNSIMTDSDNSEELYSEDELKAYFRKKFKQGKSIGIYWHGSHSICSMKKDGSISGYATIGGREHAKKPKFKTFDDWFKEEAMWNYDSSKKVDFSVF